MRRRSSAHAAIRGTVPCSGGRVDAVAGGDACSRPVKRASNRVDASIECCYDDCYAFLPVDGAASRRSCSLAAACGGAAVAPRDFQRENAHDSIIWLFNIACEHLDELGQRSVRHQ